MTKTKPGNWCKTKKEKAKKDNCAGNWTKLKQYWERDRWGNANSPDMSGTILHL